jgi:hypothetical protein
LNFVDDCSECKRFSNNYEAVTMQWFRVQGELRIAAWSRDQSASDKIVAELTRIGKHREEVRASAEAHIDAAHPRVASACSSLF